MRYHDRFVDRDAGMLYILMEYCGGGDLSTVIKQAIKCDRLLPEDTIWNYFMQILLALHHCHHPNGHGRSGSGSSGTFDADGKEKRSQILHRDIKPDNGESERFILAPAFIPSLVFLDENNTVKLGDFGLSKALAQTSFANTYVGVRHDSHFCLLYLLPADTILYVARANAGESLRLKIRYLVSGLPPIRAMCT